jgi:serine/threonine protein phosphatase 1
MRLFGSRKRPEPRHHGRIPDGQRIYAVGDIHGRADLLEQLLDDIAADDASRPQADTGIVFLGDLVDRGPDSAGVVSRVRALCEAGVARLLKGNHEEILVAAAKGDTRSARGLMGIGGAATLRSYGISDAEAGEGSFEDLCRLIAARVPADDIRFLDQGEDMIAIGDYLFVHAGVRPGVPLDQQAPNDLRWIRERFLNSREDHGVMVVHGHSIAPEVEQMPNRIGLDTGAFFTGRLSAMGFEGDARWIVAVQGESAPMGDDSGYGAAQ